MTGPAFSRQDMMELQSIVRQQLHVLSIRKSTWGLFGDSDDLARRWRKLEVRRLEVLKEPEMAAQARAAFSQLEEPNREAGGIREENG